MKDSPFTKLHALTRSYTSTTIMMIVIMHSQPTQPIYLSVIYLSINLPDISIEYLSHNNQLVSSLWYVDVAEVLPREWHDERFVSEQLQSKESDHAHPGWEHQPHHPTTQDEPAMWHNSPLSITGSATEAYIVVHRKLLSYTNLHLRWLFTLNSKSVCSDGFWHVLSCSWETPEK